MISGFHGEVDENCVLLVYFAASSGNSLPMFWDQFPKLSVRNCHYSCNNPEEHSSLLYVHVSVFVMCKKLCSSRQVQ